MLDPPPNVFPPGVNGGAPVDSPEPGGELAVRAHEHGPEDRLQVQRGRHGDAHSPQQRPVPGPGRRGGFKTTGGLTSRRMVRSISTLSRILIHTTGQRF